MKSDLDRLMQEANLDALLITGPAQHNPYMYYFTGGVHVSHGELIKPRGAEPILFANPMEREEAARTGLPTRNLADYGLNRLLKEAGGDLNQATARRYQKMLEELGLSSGRLAVYGQEDAGIAFGAFSALQALLPDLEIVAESGETTLLKAMSTKDEDEVARIRKMGRLTVEVVGRVKKYLGSHAARDGVLVNENGKPVTVGDVKSKIDLWVAELGASNPHGTIFAIGRDAGIPHSVGNPEDPLRLGQTIVFDIFIQEAGGGYHYDFTRSWCLGHAPEDVQAVYDDVRAVFDEIIGDLEANTPFQLVQQRTCDLFEARGHPTVASDPDTQKGYVHSVGHGLGLNIHERPASGANATEADRLAPGVVVTIEPGLYYPDRNMGVRLEDTIYVRPDGEIEVLAEYPLDLVIPIKGT